MELRALPDKPKNDDEATALLRACAAAPQLVPKKGCMVVSPRPQKFSPAWWRMEVMEESSGSFAMPIDTRALSLSVHSACICTGS
jgi:hypothetical protein